MTNEALQEELFKSITGPAWKKIGVRPHQGICFPLSSLHSQNSCGIGEFYDLVPMIDWCQRLGLDFIQLLPLNNAHSEGDASPYNAISSCAINFLYLSLHELPHLDKVPHLKKKCKEFARLNGTPRVDFSQVLAHKLAWLHEYYDAVGKDMLKLKEFEEFLAENHWVKPYALFKCLKAHLNDVSWTTWPEELRFPTPQKITALYNHYDGNVTFFCVLQYLCFLQLKAIKQYANEKGVLLMGDMPILLSPESADVWQHPEFFDPRYSAGAPPDQYNKKGQDWGFPIFNWDELRKKDFNWWKQRLRYADHFFDLVRIDHVLGFFRIWAIPPGHPAKKGHFIPENQLEWEPQGLELLSMIVSSTKCLPIAEDLGIVPEMVRPCLAAMGICGTKVMRWERDYEGDMSFIPIQNYFPLGLTCVSTHDSETLALWWTSYPEEAQDFCAQKEWTYGPAMTLEQREEILWESHHTTTLFHANLLQEYLAFFPELISADPEDERINVPGTVTPKNWTYRFRPSVEELVSHAGLFSQMEKILSSPIPPTFNR